MNIVAIIQARMGSTRLPGKVLLDVDGKTMLERVYDRVELSRHVNKIVIAAPDQLTDEPIWKLCKKKGWACSYGSEKDVLSRFWETATHYQADKIVRITADCPLIDPTIVDRVISKSMGSANLDYVSNLHPARTYPRGLDVEVLTMNALKTVHETATSQRHREHVTLMIYEKSNQFQISGVVHQTNLSHLRWTVDTYDDLQLANEIHSHFNRRQFTWLDIVDAYQNNPHWSDINKDVRQKSA